MSGKNKTRSLKWVCAKKKRMTSETSHSKIMWSLIETQIALGMQENIRIKVADTGIYAIHYSKFISDDGKARQDARS